MDKNSIFACLDKGIQEYKIHRWDSHFQGIKNTKIRLTFLMNTKYIDYAHISKEYRIHRLSSHF